jgi:polyferredoxin
MIFYYLSILTYFYGKRWYCSWVCGCGGVAETAGDSFRHLSSKTETSWKIERWMIHILVFLLLLLLFTFINNPGMSFITKDQFSRNCIDFGYIFVYFQRNDMDTDAIYTMVSLVVIIIISLLLNYFPGNQNILFFDSNSLREWYGFAIGSAFSGVMALDFILGNRVWCRLVVQWRQF